MGLADSTHPTCSPRQVPSGARDLLRFGRRGEPSAHRVLGDRAADDELEQVIRPARLVSDSGHPKSAKGLPADQRAGDRAVDVQVSNHEFAADAVEVGRTSRKDAPGEGVFGSVGDFQRFVQVFGTHDRQDGAENLFLCDSGGWRDVGENVRPDEKALLGEWAHIDRQHFAALLSPHGDVLIHRACDSPSMTGPICVAGSSAAPMAMLRVASTSRARNMSYTGASTTHREHAEHFWPA